MYRAFVVCVALLALPTDCSPRAFGRRQDTLHPLADEGGTTNPFHTWLAALSEQLDDYKNFRDDHKDLEESLEFLGTTPTHRRAIRAAVEALTASSTDADAASTTPSSLPLITTPYFCPPHLSNFTHWRGAFDELKAGGHVKESGSTEFHIPKLPTFFCDKVASSVQPFKAAVHYTADDIAVGVFSGEQLFWGQAAAISDTWLARVGASYVFAASPNDQLPVHGLSQFPGATPDYVDENSAQLVQMYAYRELYRKSPNKEWYFLCGSDNYVNVDLMLRVLDSYDSSDSLWLSPSRAEEGEMYPWLDTSQWPAYAPTWDNATKGNGEPCAFEWSLGSSSWVLSRPLMKAYAENVGKLLESHDLLRSSVKMVGYAPDKLTGLLLSLLGHRVVYLPWESSRPKQARAKRPLPPELFSSGAEVDERWVPGKVYNRGPRAIENNIAFHYVSPREMLSLDQLVQHETLDRMVNAREVLPILDFFRRTIDHHFSVLRRKQVQVKWLAMRAAELERGERARCKEEDGKRGGCVGLNETAWSRAQAAARKGSGNSMAAWAAGGFGALWGAGSPQSVRVPSAWGRLSGKGDNFFGIYDDIPPSSTMGVQDDEDGTGRYWWRARSFAGVGYRGY